MAEPAPPTDLALSICICTYNGAARIGAVLEALSRQTRTHADWEVLVVDNASKDDTPAVVEAGFARHVPGRGRLVHEAQPGVMFARRRAAREARGALIAYLDDDNLPAPDFVERALDIMARHPEAGIIGGRVLPEWQGTPSPIGLLVAPFALAIRDLGDQPFAYRDITGGPDTAGMVVRTDLLRTILADAALAHKITGRTGASLISGEDTAIVIRAHQLGHACRYEPALVIRHLMPAARTETPYLRRLFEGIGRGQASMRPLYDPKARVAPLALLIALKDGARWLRGQLAGPPRALRTQHGDALAAQLHDLQQHQVLGRFRQGLREPFR